ncbi:MAG: Fumarate hydratase class I, aerobic [Alphaproteobacteria bacterium MarineAlpha9_Bin2]|mgnify:CR=1 FL=1|nr:MAG: Fumarate hydratase class I, aerobic [Alphaproteobacteria bacterium MarineAlpha9_Bin1]PPR31536.1 MAG: Fumarate hydratase class I, aerobic [Alphaproteobacteria bacterium MarineAlpha9_Bin2]
MSKFVYEELFQYGEDRTEYRELPTEEIKISKFKKEKFINIPKKSLEFLSKEAFYDISHFLRKDHLKQLSKIFDDPKASTNDKYVALTLLKNANVAAGGILPMCQDTGTAIVLAEKGALVWTGYDDEKYISKGIWKAFKESNLRYSQLAPISMYEEVNTKTNLPAQIDILSTSGNEYNFLFIAKGGGSANKSFFYQATPSVIRTQSLLDYIGPFIKQIGTAACPPYHLAVVVGGTSAELNMKTLKLATCKYLDNLPLSGNVKGRAFRDIESENIIFEFTKKIGIGAQFGGTYFCHDVRVIRLPRHGASLPISIGVSCGADRQARAKINAQGVFLENLERNPSKYLPNIKIENLSKSEVNIDLNLSVDEICNILSKHPIKTKIILNGPMIVARDIAHGKMKDYLTKNGKLPDYFKNFPIYYAGPAKTPKGMQTGSFGPTTAGRMDGYVEMFQKHGASRIMLAKGNRSKIVKDSCKKYNGFYLGSIGGPGAILAQNNIKTVDCIKFPELGMEAIWKIEVVNFPAFIVIDNKGNDFFEEFNIGQ